jgi:hypothetical protein
VRLHLGLFAPRVHSFCKKLCSFGCRDGCSGLPSAWLVIVGAKFRQPWRCICGLWWCSHGLHTFRIGLHSPRFCVFFKVICSNGIGYLCAGLLALRIVFVFKELCSFRCSSICVRCFPMWLISVDLRLLASRLHCGDAKHESPWFGNVSVWIRSIWFDIVSFGFLALGLHAVCTKLSKFWISILALWLGTIRLVIFSS